MEEVKQMDDAEKIMKLPISYEEKGIEKGKEEESRRVAKEMIKEGLSIDVIAKVTQLDMEKLEKLKKGI